MREQVQSAPEIAFEIVLLMIDAITTSRQASHVAAGPLEEIIAEHGPQFIDRIEVLARRSPRIRFVLTGVWPLGNKNTPVWARIVALRATGPHIDRGDDLPPATGLA